MAASGLPRSGGRLAAEDQDVRPGERRGAEALLRLGGNCDLQASRAALVQGECGSMGVWVCGCVGVWQYSTPPTSTLPSPPLPCRRGATRCGPGSGHGRRAVFGSQPGERRAAIAAVLIGERRAGNGGERRRAAPPPRRPEQVREKVSEVTVGAVETRAIVLPAGFDRAASST